MATPDKKAADDKKPANVTGKDAPKEAPKDAPKDKAALNEQFGKLGGDASKDAPKEPPKDGPAAAASSPPPSGATGTPPPSEGATPPPADEGALEAGPIPIRKITPKDVMEKKMKEVTVPSDLFTLIGRAWNLRDGESSFGPWTALIGEFEATRISDGQRFISPQCFIPGAAGEILTSEVRKFVMEEIPVTPEQFKKTGKTYKVSGETVELALIISVKASSREGGAQHEYVTRPVVPVQKADPLAALRERMMKTLPRLAAPKPAQLAAPETKA